MPANRGPWCKNDRGARRPRDQPDCSLDSSAAVHRGGHEARGASRSPARITCGPSSWRLSWRFSCQPSSRSSWPLRELLVTRCARVAPRTPTCGHPGEMDYRSNLPGDLNTTRIFCIDRDPARSIRTIIVIGSAYRVASRHARQPARNRQVMHEARLTRATRGATLHRTRGARKSMTLSSPRPIRRSTHDQHPRPNARPRRTACR